MELVQKEGNRSVKRNVEFYNLDAIISAEYRVNSLRATSYLLGLDEKRIHIFPVEGNWNILDCCLIEWKNITKFEMKKGILLENTMNITTNEMKVSLKINKMIAGNLLVKENIKELENLNYYKK